MDQSPGNLNKNGRALDVLEKHLSQQNKRPKTNNYGALSSMWKTISESSRVATSPQKIQRQSRTTSPSRRLENAVSLSPTAPLEPKQTKKMRSSPLRKCVAFSDNIESSPPPEAVNSSPRISSQTRPSKSILKITDSPVKKVSPRRNRIRHGRPASEHLELGNSESGRCGPLNIEFWVCGEVHSLQDTNSVSEFKGLLTGGLYFMSSTMPAAHSRLFELYATLNNIMPVYVYHTHSEVKDKKISIVINNIDLILSTCTPHLIEHQSALLKTQKKDPFVSRTYVQIIRFLSFIFSNFRIVKACENNPRFQSSFQRVVECCIVTMGHLYSNKVMITAQLAFLRDEQAGLLDKCALDVSSIIEALTKMKKIESSNLICEKLLLLKQFVTRYTNVMFETVDIWLPAEVLPRLLPNQQFYSSKIASICVSILLDVLKKSLTDCTNLRVHAALKKPIQSLEIPLDLEYEDSRKSSSMDSNSTVSQLLLKSVEHFLTEKAEHKLAFDLWLSVVGLLFNSSSGLDKLCSDPINEWLLLNLKYQNAGVESVSGSALRAWRIVTYVVCTKSVPSTKNVRQIEILLMPFSSARLGNRTDENDFLFVLRGILYLALCDHRPDVFAHNFRNIVKPILLREPGSHLSKISSYVLFMLNLLCQPTRIEKANQKDFNPLKVIASTGVEREDFLQFSSQTYDFHWQMLFKTALRLQALADASDVESSFQLLAVLVRNTPKSFICKEVIDLCLNSLSDALECSHVDVRSCIVQALSYSMIAFKGSLWTTFESSLRLKKIIASLVQDSNSSFLEILKAVVELTAGLVPDLEIYDYFLSYDDRSVTSYISNSVCSKIRSSEMSNSTFAALLNIAENISSEELAESVLGICNKVRRDLGREEHQIMIACDLPTLSKYLRLRLSLQTSTVDPTFVKEFVVVLKTHNQLRFELHRILDHKHYTSLVLQAMIIESCENKAGGRLDAWTPVFKSYPFKELAGALRHFDELSFDLKLCFILRALERDVVQDMSLSSQFGEKYLSLSFDQQTRSPEVQALEYQVLKKCYDTQNFLLLNEGIKKLMISGSILPVTQFWNDSPGKDTRVIDAEALVLIISGIGNEIHLDYSIFKDRLNDGSCEFALDVIEAALRHQKHQVLIELKEDFAAFLLNCSRELKNNELRAKEALRKASTLLLVPDNKALEPALQKLLLSLPARKGSLAYEQLATVCSNFHHKISGLEKIRELINAGAPDLTLNIGGKLAPISKGPRIYHFKAVPKKSPSPEPVKALNRNHVKNGEHSGAHARPINLNGFDKKIGDGSFHHGFDSSVPNMKAQLAHSNSKSARPTDSTKSGSFPEKTKAENKNLNLSSSPHLVNKTEVFSAVENSKFYENSFNEIKASMKEELECSVENTGASSTSKSDSKVPKQGSKKVLDDDVVDNLSKMKHRGAFKLPIVKLGALKEIKSWPKASVKNPPESSTSRRERAAASDSTLSAVSIAREAADNEIDKFAFSNGVSPQDKHTKIILQIVKQFGKEEFSQLTQTQKLFLKDAMVKFIANQGSGSSNESKDK
ncbi:LAFA_0E15984g1_1 [Lachancea sp. 'fantastica']|nr:LAFA_0E15984g1_1 [Lachancea sp. 'fantastica']